MTCTEKLVYVLNNAERILCSQRRASLWKHLGKQTGSLTCSSASRPSRLIKGSVTWQCRSKLRAPRSWGTETKHSLIDLIQHDSSCAYYIQHLCWELQALKKYNKKSACGSLLTGIRERTEYISIKLHFLGYQKKKGKKLKTTNRKCFRSRLEQVGINFRTHTVQDM